MSLVTKRSPDFVDALHQTVLGDSGGSPDGLKQLHLADQPVRIFDKVAKNGKCLRPEGDGGPTLQMERLALQIGDDIVVEDVGGSGWRTDHQVPSSVMDLIAEHIPAFGPMPLYPSRAVV